MGALIDWWKVGGRRFLHRRLVYECRVIFSDIARLGVVRTGMCPIGAGVRTPGAFITFRFGIAHVRLIRLTRILAVADRIGFGSF